MSSGQQQQQQQPKQTPKVPFQAQTLADFVGLVGRLFYDDACIVLLDFLAREQRAFLEADLKEKLGWRESLVQQKLYLLEKHLVVAQDTGVSRGASRSSVYWRISHHIHNAVQYRYQQLVDRLTKLVDDATRQHEFECSDASCNTKYSALDVAGCTRALEDEHPLCVCCGSPLKPSAFEETLQQAKEKRARALRQLDPLRQTLLRVSNMDIPVFRAYSKNEQKAGASPSQGISRTSISDNVLAGSISPVLKNVSAALFYSTSSSSEEFRTFCDARSGTEQSSQRAPNGVAVPEQQRLGSLGLLSSRNSSDGVTMSVPCSIPWFENKVASSASDVVTRSERNKTSGSATATTERPSLRLSLAPKVAAPATNGQQHCAYLNETALKNVSVAQYNPHTTTQTGHEQKQANQSRISFGLKSAKQSAGAKAGAHPKFEFDASSKTKSGATSPASCPAASSLRRDVFAADDDVPLETSRIEGPSQEGELELEISRLGRKVKLSEITEDIEQCMTDEEYKIYYHAASELTL